MVEVFPDQRSGHSISYKGLSQPSRCQEHRVKSAKGARCRHFHQHLRSLLCPGTKTNRLYCKQNHHNSRVGAGRFRDTWIRGTLHLSASGSCRHRHVPQVSPSGGGPDIPVTNIQLSSEFIVWASSKEAAFLTGRFVWANWDVDELIAKKIEILEKDLVISNLKEV